MRYWLLMALALLGGGVLINTAVDEVISLPARLALIAGIFSFGAGRRMLQQKLHR